MGGSSDVWSSSPALWFGSFGLWIPSPRCPEALGYLNVLNVGALLVLPVIAELQARPFPGSNETLRL